MKKSIILLAACSIALVGCKQEKEEGAIIEINANVQTSTKAAVEGTAFPNDTKDVFAVTATKVTGDFAPANIHFASALVSTIVDKPTFSPAQFYPSAADQNLFFYAYAPVSGGRYDATGATPVVKYILNASSADKDKCDIMWAQDITGYSKNGSGKPTFKFEHKLMMFKFTVITTSDNLVGKYIKRVELLDQPIEANLDIATGTLTFGEESVGVTKKGTISVYDRGTTQGIAITKTESAVFGCAMIAPSAAEFQVQVTFGGQADGSPESKLVAPGTLTNSSQTAGYSHKIAMTMNPVEITMETSITDWIDGAGGSVEFN